MAVTGTVVTTASFATFVSPVIAAVAVFTNGPAVDSGAVTVTFTTHVAAEARTGTAQVSVGVANAHPWSSETYVPLPISSVKLATTESTVSLLVTVIV